MLGIPVNRWLSPKFSISLSKAIHYLIVNNYTVDVNYDNGSVLSTQRNKIMRAAQKEKMNLLFIDSDMIFDAEAVESVLSNTSQGDIIGGMCFMRRFPFQPVVFAKDNVQQTYNFSGMALKDIPAYSFLCDGVGCAFLYIPLAVIEEIFDNYEYPFNHIEMDNGEALGEDLSFMHRCNQLALKIVCVPNVDIGHLTERIITRKDHMSALEVIDANN